MLSAIETLDADSNASSDSVSAPLQTLPTPTATRLGTVYARNAFSSRLENLIAERSTARANGRNPFLLW